ncbi:RHS repeat domain-containing protein, partial [Pseudomonas qingdaonensis]|uniref:RHS repeat domain-containing protein n=1 Tax=Pseudomonas qingdaonensis TaxID=2056231 RepID=UPI001F0CC9CC
QLLGSQDGKSTLLKREYQYDAVGQLTDIHDTRRGHLAYQYDPIGRLLQAPSRLGVETFAFDPAGKLLDDKHHELTRSLERTPKRNRLMAPPDNSQMTHTRCWILQRKDLSPLLSG